MIFITNSHIEGGVLTFLEIDDYDTIEKNLITQIKKVREERN